MPVGTLTRQVTLGALIAVIGASVLFGATLYLSPAQTSNTLQPNCPNPCQIIIENDIYGNGQPVTVAVGTEVIWVNNDSTQHTVTSDNGAFGSQIINPRDSFSFAFNQPGTYTYHDEIHPMTGIIIVGPPYTYSTSSTTTSGNTLQPNCPNPCEIIINNSVYGNFQPVTVAVGTEVIWVNNDATQHTVIEDNGAFSSPIINPGDNFSYIFNQPGTYNYHDEIHPMTGIIIVGPPYNYSTSYRAPNILIEAASICSTNCVYPSPHLSATIIVNATIPLSNLTLYLNGTFEVSMSYNQRSQNNTLTSYALMYNATPNSATMPIVAGKTYVIEFVAVFSDNTVSTSTTTVTAG